MTPFVNWASTANTTTAEMNKSRLVDAAKLALEISEMDTPDLTPHPCMLKLSQSPQENDSLPPLLDHVTICSDDSAASSSSALDNDIKGEPVTTTTTQTTETTDAPRSIFKHYWAHSSGDLSSFKRGDSSPPPPSIVIFQYSHATLCNHEVKKPQQELQQRQQQQQRRNICVSQSLPLLSMAAAEKGQDVVDVAALPRNKSTSALNNNCKASAATTPRSCLHQECRYSGAKTPRGSTRMSSSSRGERSVDFCTEVKVLVYQEPQEHYAANGWSNYFA